MNPNFNITHLIILTALGTFGSLAVIPYSAALQSQLTLTPKVLLLSALQGVIFSAVAAAVGMIASRPLGLTVTSPLSSLPAALLLGAAAGLLIIALELGVFYPRLPEAMKQLNGGTLPLWKRILACFYGGISEELLVRFFLLSGLLWLTGRFWHGPEGLPAAAAFWTVNILIALLFGLGHLPATKMITDLTPLVITRALVLNGLAGIIFGWLFWKFGLAAAMVSHFTADVILHVISPIVTQAVQTAPA